MKTDKIDKFVVQADDQVLMQYLEIGYRIALKYFCTDNGKNTANKRKKESILCRLRKRILLPPKTQDSDKSGDEDPKTTKHGNLLGNSNATKPTKVIEIGWIHYRESDGSLDQVRAKNGGLPRKHDISKDAKKEDILRIAKEKKIRNGKGKLGNWTDFEVDILDFSEQELDEKETVGEMYIRTGIERRLRFNLATKFKGTEDILKTKEPVRATKNTMDETDSGQNRSRGLSIAGAVKSTSASVRRTKKSKCLSTLDPSIPPTVILDNDSEDSEDLPDISIDSDHEVHCKGDTCTKNVFVIDNNDTLPYLSDAQVNKNTDILALAAFSAGIVPTCITTLPLLFTPGPSQAIYVYVLFSYLGDGM